VQEAVHPDALTIFGATFDETLDDEIRVTVIATGFDKAPQAAPVPAAQPVQQEPVKKAAPVGLEPLNFEKETQAEAEAEAEKTEEEDDPFTDIFKIFNKRD